MQIYESCTGNIYIAEDGYSPERCGFCGDTDNYLGSYRKGNLKSIGETLIELMLEYDFRYMKDLQGNMWSWKNNGKSEKGNK